MLLEPNMSGTEACQPACHDGRHQVGCSAGSTLPVPQLVQDCRHFIKVILDAWRSGRPAPPIRTDRPQAPCNLQYWVT